jgi:hypothetical protein
MREEGEDGEAEGKEGGRNQNEAPADQNGAETEVPLKEPIQFYHLTICKIVVFYKSLI